MTKYYLDKYRENDIGLEKEVPWLVIQRCRYGEENDIAIAAFSRKSWAKKFLKSLDM